MTTMLLEKTVSKLISVIAARLYLLQSQKFLGTDQICKLYSTRAEQEKKEFLKKMKYAEEAFLTDSYTEIQKTLINNFFGVTNGTVTAFKQDAIDAQMSNFGYFVLLSNNITDSKKAISIYRNKDVVEKTFCNLKNRLDMNRMRASSEGYLEGKLFVQFIALIYVSHIHQVMIDTRLKKILHGFYAHGNQFSAG